MTRTVSAGWVGPDGRGSSRRRSVGRACAAFTLAASLVAGVTGAATWRLGPDGGRARALLVDPTAPGRLYAATDSGVFTSADRGEHWVRAGLYGMRVRSLALLIDGPRTLLAGTSVGVFRRDGSEWVASREGLCDESGANCADVTQLLADPALAANAYAVLASGALVRSTDGGRHWNTLTFPTSERVESITLSTASPPVLLAASPRGGLYRSTTRGGSWQDVSASLTITVGGIPRTMSPIAVAFDSSQPQRAYATGSYGVCQSTNAGQTWTPLAAPVPQWGGYISIGVDPSHSGVILVGEVNGGVRRSGDGGATWQPISDGLLCTPSNSFVAEYPSFAFESPGGGRAWALSPADGLRHSDDGGQNWVRGAQGMTDAHLTSVAADPTDEWTLFVADARGVVLKTTNAGTSWAELSTGYEAGCPFYIGPPLARPRVAGTHPRDRRFVLANLGSHGLRSIDGGSTWSTAPIADTDPVAFDHFDAHRAFYAHDVTVFRTSDGGATWPRISTAPAPVTALATTSADEALMAAALDGLSGVAVSVNGGFVWVLPTTPPPNPQGQAVAIDPTDYTVIYAATGGGLAVSTDTGDVWRTINAGLPITCTTDPQGTVTCDGGPWALAVAPTDGTLYAGGTRGLFRSANHGTTWTALAGDLEGVVVTSLAFGPHGRVLFVGTGNASVVALEVVDREPRPRLRRR